MINIFCFTLFCYGFCNIVIYGSIFSGFRNFMIRVFGDGNSSLGKLVTCFICLPTWVGFSLSLVNRVYLPNKILTPSMLVIGNCNDLLIYFISIFFDGIIASGGVWLIHTIQEYFENNNTNS